MDAATKAEIDAIRRLYTRWVQAKKTDKRK